MTNEERFQVEQDTAVRIADWLHRGIVSMVNLQRLAIVSNDAIEAYRTILHGVLSGEWRR